MSDYPEHEKMAAVKEESQVIGVFLDWLTGRGGSLWLCERDPKSDMLYVTNRSIEQILADYFKIDLKKVGEEKDQMVERLREINAVPEERG